jgi:hypothetical protein
MNASSLGAFMIGLGTIGILRLIPEIYRTAPAGARYWVIVGTDLALAFSLVAAGQGLRKKASWAPNLTSAVAGVAMITSLAMGCQIVLWRIRVHEVFADDLYWLPRLLFYLVNVAFWPFGQLAVFRFVPVEAHKTLWYALAMGGASGLIFEGVLYWWYWYFS